MERLQNVPNGNSNGQQAPDQIPATEKAYIYVPACGIIASNPDGSTARVMKFNPDGSIQRVLPQAAVPQGRQVLFGRTVETLGVPPSATQGRKVSSKTNTPKPLPCFSGLNRRSDLASLATKKPAVIKVPASRASASRKHRNPATVELDIPKPDLDFSSESTSPLENISRIRVWMPDGSIKYVNFGKFLRRKNLTTEFLKEINIANNLQQLEAKIRDASLINPNLQNIRDGLSTLSPIRGLPFPITPLFLYQLLVTNPVAAGAVLARLG